jgi:SH3-like domain-containing protein
MATSLSAHAKSIGKDQVNIRSGPSATTSIVFEAPLGYPIEIKKQEGKWVYFRDWENNTGWVYKPLVSNIKTAVILVETANVRSSASTKSNIVAKAEIGEIYKVLGTKNNWVRLGYYHGGSPLGWIRADLVFGE